jgi:hypothetical protein
MSDMQISEPKCSECGADLANGLGVMVRPIRFYTKSKYWGNTQRIQMNSKRKFFCAKCMPLAEKDWGGFARHNADKGEY